MTLCATCLVNSINGQKLRISAFQTRERWDYPDGGPAVSRVAEEDVERYWPPRRIADLVPGSAHRGKVVEITCYGIFVDVGATRDGLVHISCLENMEVRLGQEVEVPKRVGKRLFTKGLLDVVSGCNS